MKTLYTRYLSYICSIWKYRGVKSADYLIPYFRYVVAWETAPTITDIIIGQESYGRNIYPFMASAFAYDPSLEGGVTPSVAVILECIERNAVKGIVLEDCREMLENSYALIGSGVIFVNCYIDGQVSGEDKVRQIIELCDALRYIVLSKKDASTSLLRLYGFGVAAKDACGMLASSLRSDVGSLRAVTVIHPAAIARMPLGSKERERGFDNAEITRMVVRLRNEYVGASNNSPMMTTETYLNALREHCSTISSRVEAAKAGIDITMHESTGSAKDVKALCLAVREMMELMSLQSQFMAMHTVAVSTSSTKGAEWGTSAAGAKSGRGKPMSEMSRPTIVGGTTDRPSYEPRKMKVIEDDDDWGTGSLGGTTVVATQPTKKVTQKAKGSTKTKSSTKGKEPAVDDDSDGWGRDDSVPTISTGGTPTPKASPTKPLPAVKTEAPKPKTTKVSRPKASSSKPSGSRIETDMGGLSLKSAADDMFAVPDLFGGDFDDEPAPTTKTGKPKKKSLRLTEKYGEKAKVALEMAIKNETKSRISKGEPHGELDKLLLQVKADKIGANPEPPLAAMIPFLDVDMKATDELNKYISSSKQAKVKSFIKTLGFGG